MMRKFCIFVAIAALCLIAIPAKADIVLNYLEGNPEIGYFIQGSPDYDWWYGCSPTSAGMMMGYYDINGYNGLNYDNLVPGGTAEPETFVGPPTGSAALANNVIASSGHIADFWTGYGNSGDDPLASGRTIPNDFDSLADFMGTSQDSVGNSDGGTSFYYWTNGSKFYDSDAFAVGVWNSDGMYGIGEYVDYAGYDTTTLYTQLTDNVGTTYGFSFTDYMAEVDAGRVVMLHVQGHSMYGYGYGDNNTVYLHDTWSLGQHSMIWGMDYGGLAMWGVTVLEITGGVVPVPGAILLGILGLGTAGLKLRKRKFA